MMDKLMDIFPALGGRNLTVEAMDLEVSVQNALKRSGIHTLAQLLQLSHPELLQVFPNRKLRSYEDVIHNLVRLSEEAAFDKKFNIFQVAGIWKSEEIHTSVIAELINPHSAFHNMGTVFLDKFLQKINIEVPFGDLERAEVRTEVSTGEGRRIDMVISAGSCYLPFEVKIWAGDQDAQLQDYYAYAKAQAEEHGQEAPKVYYLTPDGHEPSKRSRKGLSNNQVHQLSFKEHILPCEPFPEKRTRNAEKK